MKVDIQGGTGPYTFSFNDPTFVDPLLISKSLTSDVTSIKLSDQGIDLIPNVTYKFYLKDDNGCHVQNVTGLREFTEPFADTLFLTPEKIELKNIKPYDLKCQNQQTGVIEYNVTIGDVDHTISMPLGYTFTAYNKTHDYSKTSEPGSMLVNGLLEGDYELSLVDINGCLAATKMTGFQYEPENIYWGIDTTSIRAKFDSIKVTVSEIVQPHCDYWFDGSIEVDIQNYRDQGVVYIVELYDSTESRWDQEYEDWSDSIKADPAFMIDKTSGHELYYANKQKIVEEIGIGKYKITVRDVYSECTAEVIQDIFSIEGDSCPPIDYYNVFTPLNGDGQNDVWEIYGSQYQSYTLQIYTAFGELVYSKKGISDKTGIKWDGVDFKGRPVPVGTYIYLLRKFEGTPQEILIDGNVTILRANGR
jgi:gliding motility-associated-like protein